MNQTTNATALWVKELSTSIFLRMRKHASKFQFIQRNKRQLIICFLIWIVISAAAYLFFGMQTDRLTNDFIKTRSIQIQDYSKTIEDALLDDDPLTIRMTVNEIKGRDDIAVVAFVDRRGKVMAHSDPDHIDQLFSPLKRGEQITAVGKISIQEEFLPTNEKVISFLSKIIVEGSDLGQLYVVFSTSGLALSLMKVQTYLISCVILSLLLLAGVIFANDRGFISKALHVKQRSGDETHMGSYKLREKIAEGGMAEVFIGDYLADDNFRKTVAIKRILPHVAKNREFIKMFIQEARMAALLQHPHIVQIYDFGRLSNDYFIAMEYIRGKNLAQIMAVVRRPLDIEQALFIVSRISMGLHYSHNKRDDRTGEPLNIVHRDISPQNILVSFEGEVKITDFGICKAACDPTSTSAGVIKGKVCYLAPEQALGEEVDNQIDIYALGIVFYEILSGRRLYTFSSEIEAIRSIPEKQIIPLKQVNPAIPDALNAIVMKCLEKDKEERYNSAQELNNDLIRLKQRLSITYDASDLAAFMERYFNEEKGL